MIVLVGRSGSGKTYIAKQLVDKHGFEKVVTYTTRPKRKNEINNIDYNFVNNENFDILEKMVWFYETQEYKTVDGIYKYGTSIKSILDAPDKSVIILSPDGVKQITKYGVNNIFKDIDFRVIYLACNTFTSFMRQKDRGNIKETLRRIHADCKDFRRFINDIKQTHINYLVIKNNFNDGAETILDEIIKFYNES